MFYVNDRLSSKVPFISSSIQRYNLYFVLVILLSNISCSTKQNNIKSKADAITAYSTFRDKLHDVNHLTNNELINTLIDWQVLEDTLLHIMVKDSLSYKLRDIICFESTRNDITNDIVRLIDCQQHTYTDVIEIQQSINTYKQSSTNSKVFQEADIFFNRLSKIDQKAKLAKQVLTNYIEKLQCWKTKKFLTKSDMLEFIKEEDYLFKDFLKHLYEYDSQSIQAIIKLTNEISESMHQATLTGKLDKEELNIYMGIRTNRRLIQNALACIDAVQSEQVKTLSQSQMTLSMLLNPFTNHGCIGLRTKGQTKILYSISKRINSIISKLNLDTHKNNVHTNNIPNRLIKEYIFVTLE